VKIDTKEKYQARYAKRGLAKSVAPTTSVPQQFGGKPNHLERFANIEECFPQLKVGHVQHEQHGIPTQPGLRVL
jgi:hypothetical protein